MEELIRDVEIVNQVNYTKYIQYRIKLPNGQIILLDRCRATYDFRLIPMPIIILVGFYEVEDTDKTLHQKTGVLHIYKNKYDLLLK